MSLFGSANPQKQAFTFPTPGAPTTSAGSLFGNTTPSKPLFGSTTQASSTPSLFGATTTSTPSGGLFGKATTTTTTTSSAGTLFGAAPAASTATPSLFGATTTARCCPARLLRLQHLHQPPSRHGMSFLTRRDAIKNIDPALLPKPAGTPSSSGAAGTTGPSSSVCRNLFGAPQESKRPSSSSLSISTNEPSFGTLRPPAASLTSISPTGKSQVPAKMGTFRTGQFGTGSPFGASSSTATLNVPTPSSSTVAPAASRPNIFSAGATPFGATSATTTGGSLFGSTAAKPATGGLFGSTTGSTLGGLGSLQQQQQQQQLSQQQLVIATLHPLVKAIGNPQITGTDNDKQIANINQAAAALGVGKAPYKEGAQVATYNMEGNVFEKFVGIGFNKVSQHTDDEGIVSLVLRHPINTLYTDDRRTKILEIITTILGNPQNVQVFYAPKTHFRQLACGGTEVCLIVKEGGFTASACKFAQVLNDPARLTQLEAQLQVDKTRVLPKVGMSTAQRDRYLETVPEGIDERIWRQAIAENPNPQKMLPVPVRGWEALRNRQKAQVMETTIVNEAMKTLAFRVENAGIEHAQAQVAMEAIRVRRKQLSYRLVRILLAQWISARFSRQIDTDEDVIHARCDTLLAQMNRQHQVKFFIDRFNEILETRADKLQESMFTQFDMHIEDQQYARQVLTQLLYICEGIVGMSNLQVEELEACRRALEG